MSIAHSPPENTAIFNAVNESAIGIDVHADLYVAVYQQCSFGAKNVVGHRVTTNYYVSNFVKKEPNLQSARSELCA